MDYPLFCDNRMKLKNALLLPFSKIFVVYIFKKNHFNFSFQDWFDSKSEMNYQNTTQCLVQQYNQYFQRPLRIDSRSIMIEVRIFKNMTYNLIIIKT